MAVDGDRINQAMKDILKATPGCFGDTEPSTPNSGMLESKLAENVFELLNSETDDEDCVADAVHDLIIRHRKLFNDHGAAAIRKVSGLRRRYWLKTDELDSNPSTDGFQCKLSSETTPPVAPSPSVSPTVVPAAVAPSLAAAAPMAPLVPAAAPVAAPSTSSSHLIGIADEIMKFQNLHAMGVLTDHEFSVVKAKLLGCICPSLDA